MSLRIPNIFRKNKTEIQLYIFRKINYQTNEKPDKTTSKNYFKKQLGARPLLSVNLQPSDNLTHFIDRTTLMNPLKYSII